MDESGCPQAGSQSAPSELGMVRNAAGSWVFEEEKNYVYNFMTAPQFPAKGHYPQCELFPFPLIIAKNTA